MDPQDPSAQGHLTPCVSFRRWDYPDSPCPWVCHAGLEHKLYSRGTDFTAWYINGSGKPGSSYMRRFWQQDLPEEDRQDHDGGFVWLMEQNGQPMGAVVVELNKTNPIIIGDRELHGRHARARPNKTFQAQPVGRVAMWLDPALRGRGLMKLLASSDVVPALEARAKALQSQGLFAFVRASDASACILQSASDLPVPGFFRPCLNEKEQLRCWMAAMGCQVHRHDRWGVTWEACKTASKPRAMR